MESGKYRVGLYTYGGGGAAKGTPYVGRIWVQSILACEKCQIYVPPVASGVGYI